MSETRRVRYRWRRNLLLRWAVLLAVLTGGVVAAVAMMVGVSAALDAFFKPTSPTAQAWTVGLMLGLFVAAIVGLIVVAAWTMQRTAVTLGLACGRCGGSFDRDAFEYVAETGGCPICLRQETLASWTAPELAKESPPVAEDELNPYAPPRGERQPRVVPPLPQTAAPLTGTGAHLFRLFVFGYMGWIGAIILSGVTLYRVLYLLADSPVDAQSPAWFRAASRAERFRDLGRIGLGSLLACVLFGLGFCGWFLLQPHAETMQHVVASHVACGAALGIVMAAGDFLAYRSRSLGRVIVRSNTGECSAMLQAVVPWSRASRRVLFRTQGPEGVFVTIQDALTSEPLHGGIAPAVDPDGWNELRLPLDELAAAGHNTDRIAVWIQSLDGRPWLVRYD